MTRESVNYDFAGRATKRRVSHISSGGAMDETYSYTYDGGGRPLQTRHRIGSGPWVTLHDRAYDGIGRLSSDSRGSSLAGQSSYGYNLRSWPLSVSGSGFSETLHYQVPRTGSTVSPMYSGRLSGREWTPAGGTAMRYDYSYDPLGRLSAAFSHGGGTNSTSYVYDKHGNMTSAFRLHNGPVDNLQFTYDGNRLVKAEDSCSATTSGKDFKNGASQNTEYTYDAAGRMTSDANRGVSSLQYDKAGKPMQLAVSRNGGSATIGWSHTSGGALLSKAVTGGTLGDDSRTDYVGGLILRNGSQSRLLVDGGYVDLEGPSPSYRFFLNDLHGNVAVVIDASGTALQVNNYYPYGVDIPSNTGTDVQPWRFSGKEFDGGFGLNTYDFGARTYIPDLGRFTTMDPMAHKRYGVSPYVYCGGDPVNFVDPDGMIDYKAVWTGLAAIASGAISVSAVAAATGVTGGAALVGLGFLTVEGFGSIGLGVTKVIGGLMSDPEENANFRELNASPAQSVARGADVAMGNDNHELETAVSAAMTFYGISQLKEPNSIKDYLEWLNAAIQAFSFKDLVKESSRRPIDIPQYIPSSSAEEQNDTRYDYINPLFQKNND